MQAEPGKKYEIVFDIPGKRLPRVMVARYLGVNAEGLAFDQRPEAGTVVLTNDQVTMYRPTDKKIHTPRIFRGESV